MKLYITLYFDSIVAFQNSQQKINKYCASAGKILETENPEENENTAALYIIKANAKFRNKTVSEIKQEINEFEIEDLYDTKIIFLDIK